jgi:hypothetical protein
MSIEAADRQQLFSHFFENFSARRGHMGSP